MQDWRALPKGSLSALRAGIGKDEWFVSSPFPYASLLAAYAHLHSQLCSHHHAPSHPCILPHPYTLLPIPSTHPLTPAPSNNASTHSPNFLLTHPLSLSPPTHMPTHSYNYLPIHSFPMHRSFLHPGIYSSHKVNIWVLVQPQREPCSPRRPDSPHTTAEGAGLFPRGVNAMTCCDRRRL